MGPLSAGDPALVDGGVSNEFFVFEPQSDLYLGVLRVIAAVDQVILHADRIVASDGAARRLRTIGSTHHAADDADGLASFQRQRNRRAARQEAEERFVKGAVLVNSVMLLGQ